MRVSSHEKFRNQHLSLPHTKKNEGEKEDEREGFIIFQQTAGEQSGCWLIPSFVSNWFLIYLG